MFISSEGVLPDYPHPGLVSGITESHGSWQFLGDFATTTNSLTLPVTVENEEVGLWVGMKQDITDSNL